MKIGQLNFGIDNYKFIYYIVELLKKRIMGTKTLITYWYVEPEDAHTNQVIANSLLALSQLDENVALADEHDVSHSVYQVEQYFFITRLYRDRIKLNLHFKVFHRAGKNGKLRIWTLGVKKANFNLTVKAKSRV